MDILWVSNPGKPFRVDAAGIYAIRHRSVTSQAIKAVFLTSHQTMKNYTCSPCLFQAALHNRLMTFGCKSITMVIYQVMKMKKKCENRIELET
jgi:hypothetical protein